MNGSETLPAEEIAPAGGFILPVGRRAFRFAAGVARKSPAFVGALAFFVAMMTAFIILSPEVFLRPEAYTAIFASLPLLIIMAVPSTFVITAGEIDLSFPSVVGVTALVFATAAAGGVNPFAALVLALLSGLGAGVVNGVLVTMIGLPSLVATLGMYFLLRGVVNMVTQGLPTELPSLHGSLFRRLFVGEIGTIPVQMFWGMAFAFVGILLFTKHRFGAHVRAAGDNELTTREMGVNLNLVRECWRY
jgi:simple sugar transport system permease protein